MSKAGAIIEAIQEEGFTLLGLSTFLLTFHQAEEFLEVYRLPKNVKETILSQTLSEELWRNGERV